MDDSWHFPRKKLALDVLNIFNVGAVDRAVLLAPRQKGKTFFLTHDLMPQSIGNGFFPVYANLWEHLSDPTIPIITALQEGLTSLSKRNMFAKLFGADVSEISLNTGLLNTKIRFEMEGVEPTRDQITYINSSLKQLNLMAQNKNIKILLLIDECQQLAYDHKFRSLNACLKNGIDQNNQIYALFSGSSRSGVKRLMSHLDPAFVNSAETIQLPDLESDFINFLQFKMTDEFNTPVHHSHLERAFFEFNCSPYWITLCCHQAITTQNDFNIIKEQVKLKIAERGEYRAIINKLSKCDCLTYLETITNPKQILRKDYSNFEAFLKRPISQVDIYHSLNKLNDMQLINQIDHSRFQQELPALGEYIADSLNIRIPPKKLKHNEFTGVEL